MISRGRSPAAEFIGGYSPLQPPKTQENSSDRARHGFSRVPSAIRRLMGPVRQPISTPLVGRVAAAPPLSRRAALQQLGSAELDPRRSRDLKVSASGDADLIEKAGEAFVHGMSSWIRNDGTFDLSQRLKNSGQYARRIAAAARYLEAYQLPDQARHLPSAAAMPMREARRPAIADVVQKTRTAMASDFESVLASDDFRIAELDLEELTALESALDKFGVRMDRLDDKFAAAHQAIATSRKRFIDLDELSNSASPARPIPTRKDFIKAVRAPQPDMTFLGVKVRARDTAYKELLLQLDTYHAVASGKHATVEDAQVVRSAFIAAMQSVEGYVDDPRNAESDRAAVHAHILPLQRELAVLDRAILTIKRSPQNLPQGLPMLCTRERAVASEIFDMVRGPGSEFTELNAQGAVRYGLTPELARSCATLPPRQAESMKPLGKGAINTVYLAKLRLPGRYRRFTGVYKKNSESVDEASLAAGISKDRPTSALRNLATWRLNQRLQLDVIPETHLVLNGAELGCSLERARGVSPLHTGNREVAISPEVAQRLRQEPALLTEHARQRGFREAVLEHTEEGTKIKVILESLAPDDSLVEDDSINLMDFGDPMLRRQLTRLQWLDALTGQCDRHAHNYFVERNAQSGVVVRGIDNDMAFGAGPGLQDPDTLPGRHSPSLPKVIDRATANLLGGLSPAELEALCAGLSGDEIDASKQRLAVIQQRIASFEQRDPAAPAAGRVLEDDAAWSTPETSALLGAFYHDDIKSKSEQGNARLMNNAVDAAFKSSYVARDHMTQVAAEMGFSSMPVFDAAGFQKLGS